MSEVEVNYTLRKILGKYNKLFGISNSVMDTKTICVNNSTCYQLFNVTVSLDWSPEGYLIQVTISGVDQNGTNRSFKKELSWSSEGYLQDVSEWQEV